MNPPTLPPGNDRRRHPRFEVLAQVRFRRAKTIHVLDVGNISQSGLFVRTPDEKMLHKVQVGEALELDLFTQEELENVRVPARVVRIVAEGPATSWGFGLQFTGLDADAKVGIERFVARASALSERPPPLPTEQAPFVFLAPAHGTDVTGGGSRKT
jgi:hypothetical protein